MKNKIIITLLALSTISCAKATVTYKQTYSARTVYSSIEGGLVYATCDDETGNLIYFSDSKIAVVPNGCTKK